MNFAKIISFFVSVATSALIAFMIAMSLNFFFPRFFANKQSNDQEEIRSGQVFKVTLADQMTKPLYTEIDFIETPISETWDVAKIETPLMTAQFSAKGASLASLTFKRASGGVEAPLTTIADSSHDLQSFVVALGEQTPVKYNLIEQVSDANTHRISYRAESDQAIITKTFTLFNDLYKINCIISVEPKVGCVQPRLFIPAPLIVDASAPDVVQALVYTDAQSLKKNGCARRGRCCLCSTNIIWRRGSLFCACIGC
jgi:hypothetical protein